MLRPFFLRLCVLTAVLAVSLGAGELALRAWLGYRLFQPRLERANSPGTGPAGTQRTEALAAVARDLTGPLVESGRADAAWIGTSPPKIPRSDPPPELVSRMERYGNVAACYVYNRAWVKAALERSGGLSRFLPGGHPETLPVFDVPGGTTHPVYRYPADTTLPTGLVTNRYGLRGPEHALARPTQTVRIACLGASTTVCGHSLPWSYPEFLQHWLRAWAERFDLPLGFEVFNAGREGIKSTDIVAIYEHEIRPFDVDYVIHYEGSNQFHLEDAVSWEGDERYARPPEHLLPGAVRPPGAEPRNWIGALTRRSAIFNLLAGARVGAAISGGEPEKPAQRIVWPADIDPSAPDLSALPPEFLGLGTILADLDRLRGLARDDGARLVVSSFFWLVKKGLELDPQRDQALFTYLNRRFWPISYAHIARLARFQNQVLETWCEDRGVAFLDVAGRMPAEPALFVDPIHNNDAGVRARAWIVFEMLVDEIQRDLSTGTLPRTPEPAPVVHPNLRPPSILRVRGG